MMNLRMNSSAVGVFLADVDWLPIATLLILTMAVELGSCLAVAKKQGKRIREAVASSLWKKVGELIVMIVAVIMDESMRVAMPVFPKLYALWPQKLPAIVAFFYVFRALLNTLKYAGRLGVKYPPWMQKWIDQLDDFLNNLIL